MSLSSVLPLPWLAPSLYACRACASSEVRRRRYSTTMMACKQEYNYGNGNTSRSYSTSSTSTSSASSSTSSSSSPSPSPSGSTSTQVFHTAKGRVKVDLTKRSLIGKHQSRGERPYQEDTFTINTINLPESELLRSLSASSSSSASSGTGAPGGNVESSSTETSSSSSSSTPQNEDYEQTLYCAVFDGHNGNAVSNFLRDHLHERILQVKPSEANSIVSNYRGLGGYMRRYRGGSLEDLVEPPAPRRTARIARTLQRAREEEEEQGVEGEAEEQGVGKPPNQEQINQQSSSSPVAAEQQGESSELDSTTEDHNIATDKSSTQPQISWNIVQRLHAAFLKTDLEIIKTEQEAGSTATVALLHSLDEPRAPFFASENLHLMVAHCGDTRAILCTVPEGEAVPLTETHHPEARSETDRLMRIRTGAVTDSFGESRWAGSLANTRSFGDAHYKALGVFSEPQIVSKQLHGPSYAFLILLSDGVTEKLSDQEICDLVRGYTSDASAAARNVVSFAESVGAQDNLTCLVVPLPGWGQITSQDSTKKRREFRLANFEGRSNRQNRM